MTPLKPEQVEHILRTRPGVTLEHVREYERLLVHRQQHDARTARALAEHELSQREADKRRRHELHRMLFG